MPNAYLNSEGWLLNGGEIYFKNGLTYPNKKSKTVSFYVNLKSEEISFALFRKLCTVEVSTNSLR